MVPRILAVLLAAAVTACGGGGGSTTASQPASNPSSASPASSSPAPAGVSAPSQEATPAPEPAPEVLPMNGLAASAAIDVNTLTAGMQSVRSVDALAAGGHAISWLSEDPDGTAAFYVQRFDAQGAKSGGEARIAYDFDALDKPAIAVLRDGSVIVAAVQARPALTLFVRRFDVAGAQVGAETVAASSQVPLEQPVLAALDDGGFALGWASVEAVTTTPVYAQHARHFDASARASGASVDFPAAGPEQNTSLRLVAVPGGNFVAGVSHRVAGIGYVQFRIGSRVVGAFGDPGTGLPELNTTLLALPDGRFAMWSTGGNGGYLQLLDASGGAAGAPTPVPVIPETAVAMADGGWSTVTRQLPGDPFVAQRFDAAGRSLGARIDLATGVARPIGASAVGTGFALAWTAASVRGDTDIRMQRVDAR